MKDNKDFDYKLSKKIQKVIDKIHTVVGIFRRTSVKNVVLQNNCQAEFNKELNLIIDTKT